MLYIRTAERLTRTAPWVESFEGGVEKLRRIILQDELGICADLDAEMDKLLGTYEDEWKRATQDPELRKKFRQFVNSVCSFYQPYIPNMSIAQLITRTNADRQSKRYPSEAKSELPTGHAISLGKSLTWRPSLHHENSGPGCP